MYYRKLILLFFFLLVSFSAFAQSCPTNIGFEDGSPNLTGWKCYTGTLDQAGTAPINWVATDPVPGRHQIIKNTSPQILDPYGSFPINSPNSSLYSLQLGNSEVSGGGKSPAFCERITYDFTVPNSDFTLIYYYAVVFQNPKDHDENQQPKFIANVINLDDPTDQSCGSFSFTSSAGLEGFHQSGLGTDVYYKPWSPITIKLSNKQGKHYQLEFITRDCSKGGHFGYAYLDFNENCATPITGNNYCMGSTSVSLTAPAGFDQYQWFDSNGTQVSTDPTLKISPPVDSAQYSLHIIPYVGLGCENTFYTVVHQINEVFYLKVAENVHGCKADGFDLTQDSITAGSTAGLKYEYYTDADGQNFLSDPKHVTESGTYYIRGTNASGCTDIFPVTLQLYDGPKVTVTTPKPVCKPATVDLTKAVSTTDDNVTFSYYSDAALTIQLTTAQAQAISRTGTYYVKAVIPGIDCPTVNPVDIIVSALPADSPKPYGSCPPLNLYLAVNDPDAALNYTYKFYTDAAGTQEVPDPANITVSGTYYYKAINQYGCEGNIAALQITVYPEPTFNVTDPAPVVYPLTVNLTDAHTASPGADFTYWMDAATKIPIENYQAFNQSGTFYIKAVNAGGCIVLHPVHVLVNAPPEADLVASNTFTPNGDGINDEFNPTTQGVLTINYLKIFNRYGKEIFDTKQLYNRWNGTFNGKPEPAGTYYWVFSCYDIYRKKIMVKSGSVTVIR